jgi:ABC-type Fe3+/spermidine/putrescine transport system ATPase subunit
MSRLSVRDLVVRYGDVTAVDRVSFDVAEGEFVSLLGPSGCGKTTTLRCVAGLEAAAEGQIRIGDDLVTDGPAAQAPERRGVNMVFQSYAVWPHMTVFDNIAYGLRTRRMAKAEIATRVTDVLRLVGLTGLEARYGTELSGGQQQRVAVARAVVTAPRLLLFDEPLSNLDAGLRERMRFELVELQRRLGRTSIYVTHDQSEAMVMSDRIILMNQGRIVQEGSPRALYERPASRFAAAFVGNANLLEARVTAAHPDGSCSVTLADGFTLRSDMAGTPGDLVLLCIRPENIELMAAGTGADNLLDATAERISYLGSSLHCEIQVRSLMIRAEMPPRVGLRVGDRMHIRVDPVNVVIVPPD